MSQSKGSYGGWGSGGSEGGSRIFGVTIETLLVAHSPGYLLPGEGDAMAECGSRLRLTRPTFESGQRVRRVLLTSQVREERHANPSSRRGWHHSRPD